MLPSYNNINQNFNAFSNNLSIYNNTSAQQNNNTYNKNVPHNYNQQRVVNPNPNQGAHYYSNMDNPLNNKRFTHQQNQVVITNGINPNVGNTNYNQNNKQIISIHYGINSPQINNNNNNFQRQNNNNLTINNNGNQLSNNYETSYIYSETKNKTYLRYIEPPSEYASKVIPQNKYIININKEQLKSQIIQKNENDFQKMIKRQKNERNNFENPPQLQEKKEIFENDKINGVMEDMCIYGNMTKNEILNEKQNNPKKFIPMEVALNNEQQEPGLFALALMASDLKNKGIETAIVNDNEIVDKKQKEEEENTAITCLQFMANGLIYKKKYEFHFDLDNNRVNEILNNKNELERFKENLKQKLHKEFNIPKDKIIITFPQIGSLIVQVIIQSDEFNDIKTDEFLKRFKNDEYFSELKTLKEVHEGFLMNGCKLSRLLLDPLGNRSEWPQTIENRGGEPYYPPYGWIGIGLKVFDQYKDDRWLDMQNLEGEWVVAYHGLGRAVDRGQLNPVIGNVVRMGFKPGGNQIHINCEDFYHKGKKVGEGVYVTPYIHIAEEYAGTANVNGVNYKIVIMVRVNPSARRHCMKCEESRNYKYWVVNATIDEIRPYRILYKKCE